VHSQLANAAVDDVASPSAARLLGDEEPDPPAAYDAHLSRLGAVPERSPADLLATINAAGLTGRGGAAFPVARKMHAVAAGALVPVVVANGSEGEPAAWKDKTLLWQRPHLVLDGLAVAARAVGADRAILYLHSNPKLLELVTRAVMERRRAGSAEVPVEVIPAPGRFIAGEESAVVSYVDGGPAHPRYKPPRVFEAGIGGRPTLVQNVETLAHVGLIARFGAEWFRDVGTEAEPGSMLFSVSGGVGCPEVVEAPIGVSLTMALAAAGGLVSPPQAILFGGYHGSWLSWDEAAPLSLSNLELRQRGSALGAGVIVALPADRCGLVESARVMRYLAAESAGQCGPCLHGLPLFAEQLTALARLAGSRRGHRKIDRYAGLLAGRGACHHPDGSLRFARSALRVFGAEVDAHLDGACTASCVDPVLPTPGVC
jgi:NADH:ubiquinone oxidoreductase subunit F (NADH-binding)